MCVCVCVRACVCVCVCVCACVRACVCSTIYRYVMLAMHGSHNHLSIAKGGGIKAVNSGGLNSQQEKLSMVKN